jgi:transposase-like protein
LLPPTAIPIFPNLAKDIARTGPNQPWIGDITYSWFSQHRDLPVAKRFLRRALQRHCRPDRIVIDGSQTNREAIRVRKSQYLNNWIEQDHRRTKRRVRPMLGFKAFTAAAVTLAGIDMVHMMRKRQGRFAFNPLPTLKE